MRQITEKTLDEWRFGSNTGKDPLAEAAKHLPDKDFWLGQVQGPAYIDETSIMKTCKLCGHPQFPHNFRHAFEAKTEDRVHRKGVVSYKVKVYPDGEGQPRVYTVNAVSELDARCIAFLLDGGSARVDHWDDGHIELAFMYTEVAR